MKRIGAIQLRRSSSTGFTLIELMLVIAIIGILFTIGLPAYQDYVVRARVIEGLQLAYPAKMAVSEAVMSRGVLPHNQAEAGYESPKGTENVHSIVIRAKGVITVAFTVAAGGGTLIMEPTLHENGEITWSCLKGTLPKKYRPASCRTRAALA
jgi:type IV pilus assembly protein PilA